jgi:hypothetical protein
VVNVETFRRVEIKHTVGRKSFHAMRTFHVMRNFYAKAADTACTQPARSRKTDQRPPNQAEYGRADRRTSPILRVPRGQALGQAEIAIDYGIPVSHSRDLNGYCPRAAGDASDPGHGCADRSLGPLEYPSMEITQCAITRRPLMTQQTPSSPRTHRDTRYRRSARKAGRDLVCSKGHHAGQRDRKLSNPTIRRIVCVIVSNAVHSVDTEGGDEGVRSPIAKTIFCSPSVRRFHYRYIRVG